MSSMPSSLSPQQQRAWPRPQLPRSLRPDRRRCRCTTATSTTSCCPIPADPTGYFCGGLTDVPLHVEIDGYFSIKDRGPNAPSLYFADRFRSTLVYTNPQTELTYTVVRVRQTKDLRLADNGDGTLTLTGLSTGSLWAYGPDGELLGRQNGLTRETFLLDTMGTPDPIDDVLTRQDEPFTAGLVTTTNFCDDFLSATNG